MRSIAVLIALFISNLFQAQTDSIPEVTVTIENIQGESGSILVGLYSEKTFLKAKPEFSEEAAIVNGKANVTFKGLPAGTYAISCFHDKNGNSQMDFEPTGMPLEPYGISNNKINYYGPPLWNDAKFNFEEQPLSMSIRLSN
tara:strand:- start:127257 stop:127682 length:426 start_codon:yes stop_codon:yes gene_type:complete